MLYFLLSSKNTQCLIKRSNLLQECPSLVGSTHWLLYWHHLSSSLHEAAAVYFTGEERMHRKGMRIGGTERNTRPHCVTVPVSPLPLKHLSIHKPPSQLQRRGDFPLLVPALHHLVLQTQSRHSTQLVSQQQTNRQWVGNTLFSFSIAILKTTRLSPPSAWSVHLYFCT